MTRGGDSRKPTYVFGPYTGAHVGCGLHFAERDVLAHQIAASQPQREGSLPRSHGAAGCFRDVGGVEDCFSIEAATHDVRWGAGGVEVVCCCSIPFAVAGEYS